MRNFLARLRVRLAMLLCKGTNCSVVRDMPTMMMLHQVGALAQYVEKSGGLSTHPTKHRLHAYKTILRTSNTIIGLGRQVLAGPFPKMPKPQPQPQPATKEEEHGETEDQAKTA